MRCDINVHALSVALKPLYNAFFSQSLLHAFRFGFDIGFVGRMRSAVVRNRPSALQNAAVVSQAIATEVERGHTAGPFPLPPFPAFMCSP